MGHNVNVMCYMETLLCIDLEWRVQHIVHRKEQRVQFKWNHVKRNLRTYKRKAAPTNDGGYLLGSIAQWLNSNGALLMHDQMHRYYSTECFNLWKLIWNLNSMRKCSVPVNNSSVSLKRGKSIQFDEAFRQYLLWWF